MPKTQSKGPRLAEELFKANYNCAQSSMAGILSDRNRAYEDKIRIAGAFGAGIAQTGGLCGVLTGALMAFGVLTPIKGGDIAAWKNEVAAVSKEFMARFRTKFGELSCSGLCGCDMSNADVRKLFHDEGGRERVCAPMVTEGVELALEFLLERG